VDGPALAWNGRGACPANRWPDPGRVVKSPCFHLFPGELVLLSKKTVQNQITLPEAVATRFPEVEYFDVSTDGECIILRPLQLSRADEVRARLDQLGIDEQDVTAAVSWSRENV
jgi:hypothetical protein